MDATKAPAAPAAMSDRLKFSNWLPEKKSTASLAMATMTPPVKPKAA